MGMDLTIQSNIKNYRDYTSADDITKYALFMGGLNTTNEALKIYDPLRTGYGRIFMVRKPEFLNQTIPQQLKTFKHILEYGNTSVSGLSDITVDFNQYQGGYTNKSFEIPSVATDGTNELNIKVYEFSGSPVREVIYQWINGTTDLLTGLSHYNGEETLARIQANQTAEFIYVNTDHTGKNVEYACLFTNCFPKNLKNDHFNYDAGQHQLVEYDIQFTATKYESIQINRVAKALLDKYKVLSNSLNFYSGYTTASINNAAGHTYNPQTGKLETGYSANEEVPVDVEPVG